MAAILVMTTTREEESFLQWQYFNPFQGLFFFLHSSALVTAAEASV